MNKNTSKILLVAIVIIGVVLFLTGTPTDLYKKVTLQYTYLKIFDLNNNKNWEELYNYLSPQDRLNHSLTEYLSINEKNNLAKSPPPIINGIEIDGNVGYVDRTLITCDTDACEGTDRHEVRNKKKYYFFNWQWYIPWDRNNVFCLRKTPYNMPEEFKRALSLVIQRLNQGNVNAFNIASKNLSDISNCLDMQYAPSEAVMNGAEGFFTFNKNSDPEDLQIFISPKYQVKDDLVTAMLLSHELIHAMYKSMPPVNQLTCFENETDAFSSEFYLIQTLNQEEKNSLLARYYNGTTPEITQLWNFYNTVQKYPGSTLSEKIQNALKDDPNYQKECANQ